MSLERCDPPPSLTLVIPASIQVTPVTIIQQDQKDAEEKEIVKEAYAPMSADVLACLQDTIEYQRHEFTTDSLYVLRGICEAESSLSEPNPKAHIQGNLSTRESLKKLLGVFQSRASRVTTNDHVAMCKLYYEVSKRVEILHPAEFSGSRAVHQAEKMRKWKQDQCQRQAAERNVLADVQQEQDEVSARSKSILSSVRQMFPQSRPVNERGGLL